MCAPKFSITYPEGGVNGLQALLVKVPFEAGRYWWVASHLTITVTILVISVVMTSKETGKHLILKTSHILLFTELVTLYFTSTIMRQKKFYFNMTIANKFPTLCLWKFIFN